MQTEDPSFFQAGVNPALFPINRPRHLALAALLRSFPPTSVRVLEIGSFLGQSALMWSQTIADHFQDGGSVLCVDPWQPFLSEQDVWGGDLYQQTQASLEDGSAFEQFKVNITTAPSKAPISFFRGTLKELVEHSLLLPFDVVYIDGSHYYQDVKTDLLFAQPLVRDGGILCGDDLETEFPETDQEECRRCCNRDYVSHYHPGVTLAVWEAFGRVRVENGAWAVRREGDSFIKF